jgi:hypothetical protein
MSTRPAKSISFAGNIIAVSMAKTGFYRCLECYAIGSIIRNSIEDLLSDFIGNTQTG